MRCLVLPSLSLIIFLHLPLAALHPVMPPAPLLHPAPPSDSDLAAFLDRHEHLLSLERSADEEQTRLLNSNCSPKLLEQRGLALGGLGVGGINIGLGGKKWVRLESPFEREMIG